VLEATDDEYGGAEEEHCKGHGDGDKHYDHGMEELRM